MLGEDKLDKENQRPYTILNGCNGNVVFAVMVITQDFVKIHRTAT